MNTLALVPCRLESQRIPRKALLEIDGLPMVVHTFKRARLASTVDEVYVCTDSTEIAEVVRTHGGRVLMTLHDHTNGTERVAEAAQQLNLKRASGDDPPDLVVDVQADQPLLDPQHLDAIVQIHRQHAEWDILIPSLPMSDPESPHVVKIVKALDGRIISMSRAVIPYPFQQRPARYLHHLDSISFHPDALERFAHTPPTPLEQVEGIELLRALEAGAVLGTVVLEGSSFSVNMPDDLERARAAMGRDPIRHRYS